MSKRRTPEERQAAALAAMAEARRDAIQATLDQYAAIADSRKLPRSVGTAIRNVLHVCDLFGWDTDKADQLCRAVMAQFDTRKPLADIVERAEAAAQAMRDDPEPEL
jgi:hypothetical protein